MGCVSQFWIYVPMVSSRNAVDAVDEQVCIMLREVVCQHFLYKENLLFVIVLNVITVFKAVLQ